MITLKELVDNQKWNEMTDIQVIKAFFEMNDLEENAINLISELSKSKISKMKNELSFTKEWVSYLPSQYLYETYDLDTADRLHTLELDFLTNNCKLSKRRFKWAKENVPSIKRPQAYFNPLVDYLKENGIEFMK